MPKTKRVPLNKRERNGLGEYHDAYLKAQRELLAAIGRVVRSKGITDPHCTFEGFDGSAMIVTLSSV